MTLKAASLVKLGWKVDFRTSPSWHCIVLTILCQHLGLRQIITIAVSVKYHGKPNRGYPEIPKFFPFSKLYFEFTATNRMSGKNLWAEIFGPKVGKVCYFKHFFQFFEYNFRNINFRRKNLPT